MCNILMEMARCQWFLYSPDFLQIWTKKDQVVVWYILLRIFGIVIGTLGLCWAPPKGENKEFKKEDNGAIVSVKPHWGLG